jgi:formamidopyrimidine-DNA glycosylase
MPELPEVETIKRGLEKRISGKKIHDLIVKNAKSFQGQKDEVIGLKVSGVERRAKVIRIKLEKSLNLLFHLKMTGQLIFRQKLEDTGSQSGDFAGGHPSHDWHVVLPNSNTQITFVFEDGSELFFNDMRKFGWCKVLSNDQITKIFEEEYGPEPYSDNFTTEYLMRKAVKIPNRNIKQFLTDQTIIAGIGNIYADESLFEAKISPLRKVKDISLTEWKNIIISVLKVLDKAIKYGGTTDSDYVNSEGKKGGMQEHLNVYHRTGLKCPAECGGVVKRITIGGRGTHYCPSCQK